MIATTSTRALDTALEGVKSRTLTPALVIDLDAVDHNICAFLACARAHGARWRPHIKTVKQRALVARLLAAGVDRFKCATLPELDVLLSACGEVAREVSILLAYPCTDAALRALASRQLPPRVRVAVLADGPAHLTRILGWAAADGRPWDLYLDVDVGMHRTGSAPSVWIDARPDLDAALARAPNVSLRGLHGYDGHHRADDQSAAHGSYDALCAMATSMALASGASIITAGTHSFHHALAHAGLREGPWDLEVSPGTVVLSDLRSAPAATRLDLRQAVYVATSVISTGPGRVTLDAGSKGLNPDVPPPHCLVMDWHDLEPRRPSEEHLPLRVPPGAPAPALGDVVWLVPAHACTTVNLYRHVLYVRTDQCVGPGQVQAASRVVWDAHPTGEDGGEHGGEHGGEGDAR